MVQIAVLASREPNAKFQFPCGSTAIGLFNILDSDSKPGAGIEAIGDS
jgi:hypothetical protein